MIELIAGFCIGVGAVWVFVNVYFLMDAKQKLKHKRWNRVKKMNLPD
jgi:hypothetical protein